MKLTDACEHLESLRNQLDPEAKFKAGQLLEKAFRRADRRKRKDYEQDIYNNIDLTRGISRIYENLRGRF
jgi:hypothetical protein